MSPEDFAKMPLSRLLETSWFRRMLTQVNQLQHLQEILKKADAALAERCQVAGWHGDSLRLAVKSSAWLTRVRYATPQLIRALRQYSEFAALQTIDCFVSPLAEPTQPQRLPNKISTQNKQLIQQTITTISDTDLKAALMKLIN